jgi:AraC-like DNA-binding protein
VVNFDLLHSASSVHLLTQLGAERGLSVEECLKGTGVASEMLLDPNAEVTTKQEFDVIRNLLAHFGDEPGLGVEAGTRYHLSLYGVWGLALIASPTLRATIDIAIRYMDLAFAFGQVTFVERDGHGRMGFVDDAIPADIRPFLVERVLTGIQTVGTDLFSAGIPLAEVRLRHPAPADTSRHREVFGVEPTFGAEVNELAFDAAFLDLALPQANEWARQTCEQLCRELLTRRQARTGIAGTVRDRLVRSPGQLPDQSTVAAELHVSPRTLFRRLSEEGTSFRALVEEVRETLAEELLCTAGMTTEQVSYRLGYAEPACFVRAFRRWKGTTPHAYRALSSGSG